MGDHDGLHTRIDKCFVSIKTGIDHVLGHQGIATVDDTLRIALLTRAVLGIAIAQEMLGADHDILGQKTACIGRCQTLHDALIVRVGLICTAPARILCCCHTRREIPEHAGMYHLTSREHAHLKSQCFVIRCTQVDIERADHAS